MTDPSPSPERLQEVSRLAGALAERVRAAQMLGEPVEDAQVKALLEAALLLEESGIAQPPLVMEALQKVDDVSARGGQPVAHESDPEL